MRTHIPAPDGTLCNSRSVVAHFNSSDCQHCLRRMERILDFIEAEASAENPRALALLKSLNWTPPADSSITREGD